MTMRQKELRIGLVCYGGVSLAVYMHGVTKEVWNLARASRDFHTPGHSSHGVAGEYRRLLDLLADRHDLRPPPDRSCFWLKTVAGAPSTSVFHSAQSGHCPCQRGETPPQA